MLRRSLMIIVKLYNPYSPIQPGSNKCTSISLRMETKQAAIYYLSIVTWRTTHNLKMELLKGS